MMLLEGPAVSCCWSFSGRSAVTPPRGDGPLREGIIGLFVKGSFAGYRPCEHLRFCASSLAAHAAAVAPVTVEEEEPYANPDKCDNRDNSDDDKYCDGGCRNAT
jgi:hypothetical protein